MYENPITMYMSDINKEIQKQTEEESMIVINQTVGFDVDKEELIKALQYDREQYEKGFSDGENYMLDRIKQAREEIANKYDDLANAWCEREEGRNEAILEVLEILDNLIAESED